jgi:hypothetical protein
MRLPSITTPEAVTSLGACLVQGLNGSGKRMVANTFTTEFSIAGARSVSADRAAAGGIMAGWKLLNKPRLTNAIRLKDVM